MNLDGGVNDRAGDVVKLHWLLAFSRASALLRASA
jgi:hypothetical protein